MAVDPDPEPSGVDPEAVLRKCNIAVVQRESAALGVINATGIFLPVFLLRIGGSNLAVSLLTALPALAGFLLSIPAGAFLQTRRNVIPWYTATRGTQFMVYAGFALAVAILPADLAVLAVLLLWISITLPATISNVASNVVLNVAGPRGRYDLLSRRYGIMGLTTAVAVAILGQLLEHLAFPFNYELIFVATSVAGIVACFFSIRIKVPDQAPAVRSSHAGARARLAGYTTVLRNEPRFISFVTRRFLMMYGIGIAAPLVPLWYIREVHAPDSWIGLLGTASSLGALAGFYGWRRASRRVGNRRLLIAATFGAALSPALLALTHELLVIGAIAAFASVTSAGITLVLFDEMMKTMPLERLVTFSGVDNSLSSLASIAGPLSGAVLSDVVGIGPGLLVAAVVTLLGAVLLTLSAKQRSEPAASRAEPTRRAGPNLR